MAHRRLFSVAAAAMLVAVAVAARAQGGDPLQLRDGYHMVLFDQGGKIMTYEQFKTYVGRVRWELQVDKPVPANAQELLRKGRQAGASGDYAAAVELFAEAGSNAPEWEYPIYETAWAHLLSGDAAAAEEYFGRVNTMAPHGFFNSQQAADCLRREREGSIAQGTYRRIVLLDRASRDTALLALRDIVDRWPDYPAAWERLAFYTKDTQDAMAAIEKGLSAKPDAYTRDALRMRRALLTGADGRRDEAIRMLEKMLADPKLSMSIEAQIKIALPGLRRAAAPGSGGGR